ncbi:MAG: LysR family transcriptional regulator [Pseudomonadota bacterium]
MKKTTPFDDIRLFQRVAELGSIRGAAREEAIEPSSVSRRMNRLESRLGTKLLERAQNRTQLTDAGASYYEHMRVLVPQFEAAESAVSGDADTPKGLLKVDAAIDFGQQYVAKWLLSFQQKHPQVQFELSLSSRHVDLVAEGIDVAIRVGNLRDSSLKARRLASVPRVLVASPDYLVAHGNPETPADLQSHQHVFFSRNNRIQLLELHDSKGATHTVKRQGRVTINAVSSLVDAVKMGCGVHTGPRWAFQDAIDSGDVVELLPGYSQRPMTMSAIWAPAVLLPARIRAFIDFAAAQASQIPGLEV